jgi:hypothetical protein
MTTSAKRELRDLASLVGSDVADAAFDARHAVQRLLARAQSSGRQHRAERIRLTTRKVAGEYMDAMSAIRAAAMKTDLEALRAVLRRRLSEGYRLTPNAPRDALWTRLLAEFELVSDARAENSLGRYIDRLNDLERLT